MCFKKQKNGGRQFVRLPPRPRCRPWSQPANNYSICGRRAVRNHTSWRSRPHSLGKCRNSWQAIRCSWKNLPLISCSFKQSGPPLAPTSNCRKFSTRRRLRRNEWIAMIRSSLNSSCWPTSNGIRAVNLNWRATGKITTCARAKWPQRGRLALAIPPRKNWHTHNDTYWKLMNSSVRRTMS